MKTSFIMDPGQEALMVDHILSLEDEILVKELIGRYLSANIPSVFDQSQLFKRYPQIQSNLKVRISFPNGLKEPSSNERYNDYKNGKNYVASKMHLLADEMWPTIAKTYGCLPGPPHFDANNKEYILAKIKEWEESK